VIPEFGGQIELGVAKIDFAEVRARLSTFSFEGVAFDTPFIYKESRSPGRILGKDLGKGRMGHKKYKRSHDDNRFLHNDPLKPTVKIEKLTM
jgi:hypothetical protein